MRYRWYDRGASEVLRLVESDGEKGLSRKEAATRLKEDGKNCIYPVVRAPVRSYFAQVLSDLTSILLLIGAALALVFSYDITAFVMVFLLVINCTITLLSYTKAQKLLEEFGRRSGVTAKVMRAGRLLVIPAESVVQGDVILLTAGDVVPCDCRLLDSEDLQVMESGLFDVEGVSLKDASYLRAGNPPNGSAPNMVYASTVVMSGRAKAVAVETGPDTVICRKGKNEPIAACHKLDVIKDLKRISRILGVAVLVPVFLFIVLALMRQADGVIEVFLSTLAFAVASMPEMYTAFAYVIVTCGMQSVLKRDKGRKGAFIKNPTALPQLASLDCLLLPMEAFCCEKASRLAEVFDGSEIIDLSKREPGKEGERVIRYGLISTGIYGTERLAVLHQRNENVYSVQQEAILEAGQRYELYSKKLEEEYPLLEHLDKGERGSLFETTLVHYRGQDVVVLRGEPEAVISRCTGYYKEGRVLPLDAGLQGELLALAGEFSRNNRQPVAVATKFSRYNTLMRISEAQTDLIFEGFLAIEKPFLPEGAKEVLRMRDAGIKVLVYCADEGEEHRHRARALGIASKDEQMVRFSELADVSEEIFGIRLKKYTLFEGFDGNALGYVVAQLKKEYGYRIGVLGRDLSFLSVMYEADVSFSEEEGHQLIGEGREDSTVTVPVWSKGGGAVERGGCQALNHLSDVILPSVNVSGEGGVNGVATALRHARFIYRSIGVLLQYLTFTGAMRFTAMLFSMGTGFYLTAVQSLLLGLIFDLAAVFVIAFQRPEKRYAEHKVYREKKRIAQRLWGLLPSFGIGAVLCAGVVFCANALENAALLSADTRSSFVFCTLLLLQLAMLIFCVRTDRPVGRSVRISPPWVVYAALLTVFLLACLLIPMVGTIFTVRFMGWPALGVAFALPTVFLLFSSLARLLLHKRKK